MFRADYASSLFWNVLDMLLIHISSTEENNIQTGRPSSSAGTCTLLAERFYRHTIDTNYHCITPHLSWHISFSIVNGHWCLSTANRIQRKDVICCCGISLPVYVTLEKAVCQMFTTLFFSHSCHLCFSQFHFSQLCLEVHGSNATHLQPCQCGAVTVLKHYTIP